jgi:hypothetical protein
VHVSANGLLRKGFCSLRLALLLLGQPLARLPVLLGLGVQAVDGPVEEDLGELRILLLSLGATLCYRLVGLDESVGELFGGLVHPLLLLLVSHAG